MPQTQIEKKFFRVRVGKTHHHLASIIGEKPIVVKFQQFQQNIAGGAE